MEQSYCTVAEADKLMQFGGIDNWQEDYMDVRERCDIQRNFSQQKSCQSAASGLENFRISNDGQAAIVKGVLTWPSMRLVRG